MPEQVPLGIVDATAPSGSHMVAPFLAEGIRSEDKCVSVLEAPGPQALLIRPGGHADPGHFVETGRAEFFPYESLLTAAISALPEVVICLYDLERFGAEVLMDTLRTHPRVLIDGMIHDNPYYIEPGAFLAARG
ncbi:MAG TPA: MEDS domain-containing protein [Streptosporangiaceae bacterium]|jgi:hypothetical protein|nr:MEDS domain-containing protein [Streptosporangiaceae bacterium]